MNYVNMVTLKNGKVRAVCQCCGKKSKAGLPDQYGEPSLWNMGMGWRCAPFPEDCVHDDGSVGSTYDCPSCSKRLKNGESLRLRNYAI